ncbi:MULTISPECIES: hypothetical protein [unclassified Sphingomonas]|uniref:hypothetical protein n=1 Tax=unclassified Sphingomonas TaxID=196159 RepID=UPI000B07C0CD|nr:MULTISPECIES: hypothetical protein [unclassified Sphingomonas]
MSELGSEEKHKKNLSVARALRPKRVISLYGSMNGGPVHTRQILALCLREGRLRCRVSKKWVSSKESILESWKANPKPEINPKDLQNINKHYLKRSFWWRSVCWLDDVAGWDFSQGRMYITVSLNPLKRIMLFDARFHSGDIKKILVPGSLKLVKGSFEKLRKLDQWRIFWHEMFMLATNDGELAAQSTLASLTSEGKVIDKIRNDMAAESDFWKENRDKIDEDLASIISSRSVLDISDHTVTEEIKLLRQALKVTRVYNQSKIKR